MVNDAGLTKNINSFMFTFLQRENATVVLVGHPPRSVIEQALRASELPKALVIEQEEMHDEDPKSYDLLLAQGDARRFDVSTPLDQALRQMGAIRAN